MKTTGFRNYQQMIKCQAVNFVFRTYFIWNIHYCYWNWLVYFCRNLGLANGISTSSVGCGTLIIAPILQLLLNKFGLARTFLFLGAAELLSVAACFILAKMEGRQKYVKDNEEEGPPSSFLDVCRPLLKLPVLFFIVYICKSSKSLYLLWIYFFIVFPKE